MECTCRFYELDLKEKEEFKKFCTTLPFENDKLPDIPSYEYGCSILSVCANFCKHLKIAGEKDPIPYSYRCCAAGNEHVIYSP